MVNVVTIAASLGGSEAQVNQPLGLPGTDWGGDPPP